MNRSVLRLRLVVFLAAVFCAPGSAWAQGATSQTLSGTVVDASGAVIPGADVSAKHIGTGVVSTAVSNSEGLFSIPSLPIGAYTVTVTLQGFKTVVINDVVLTSGAGANVKATMEVGGVTEQVTVSSSSEIIQTQSSGVTQTVNTNQISKLPMTSRSAMDFVNLLPGVSSPSGNRNATVNGLPRTAINITLDGVNVQDNTNKGTSGGDGFFAIVSPRLDAIEEVTVSSAAQGAEGTGNGAVQIKFVTRSGTNSFSGSGYEYYRSDKLNANTWFNNRAGVAKPKLKQNQVGFRAGGPIVMPGYDGRNKAFFFFNYEELRQPSDTTRNRNVLNPAAQNGLFSWATGSANVLALAGANGQTSTVDPTIGKLLSDIRSAMGTTGSLAPSDANVDRYTYNIGVSSLRRYPTARVDYNITNKHRFNSAYNYQKFTDFPDTLNNADPSFPGFPVQAGQSSVRLSWSNGLRSTLGRNLVNEAHVAYAGAPVKFFTEFNKDMFTGTLANQQGFRILFPTVGSALQGATPRNPGPSSRDANTLDITDSLTWLKGSHTLTVGGGVSNYRIWLKNSNLVPTVTTGMLSTDPAAGLFTAANFPGASTTQITAARDLYAFLTGRVTQIEADARIDSSGKYVYVGQGLQRGAMKEFGGFVQDQWRMRQNLTVNAGLRYDIQEPFQAANSNYTFGDLTNICGVSGTKGSDACNLFQPGTQPGVHPVFQQYKEGVNSYAVDYNNVAPSAGVAWTPTARPGFLRYLMGEGDFVVRGGFATAFSRPALGDFTAIFNNNPGITIPVTRSDAAGNLIPVGSAPPLLLRNSSLLGPPAFSETPTYPIKPTLITQSIAGFDPDIQMPYSNTYQVGITRSLGKTMAFEARYVGTRGYGGWDDLNYNQINIVENGFLKEFRQAQANLQANIAAGRGNTFAYTGAPGTAPLPIFLAHYSGQSTANAGNSALYTGNNWTNTTFLGFLAAQNPNPYGFASTNGTNGLLGNSAFRNAALSAGLPQNFWVANPDLIGGALVRSNLNETRYNSLQLELRRRLSQGLQFQTSYVRGHGDESVFLGFGGGNVFRRDTGDPGDLSHAFKSNVVYDLPFGRGRRFGGNSGGIMDRVIGGWQVSVASKVQSGRLVNLGNVRLVGMSKSDAQSLFTVRLDDAGKQVYMWPQDIVDNTILAFAVSATSASGYAGAAPTGRYFAPANRPDCIETENNTGACGVGALTLTGPMFQQHDIAVRKRTSIGGRVNFEFAAEMLNALNQHNFTPITGFSTTGNPPGGITSSSTVAGYQLTGLSGTNTARVIQIVTRVNW